MSRSTMPVLRAAATSLVALLLVWTAATAQERSVAASAGTSSAPTPTAATAAKKPGRPWRISPVLALDTEYDNNVFLLEANRKDNVASPTAADVTSGRYADMEDASDLITTLSLAFDVKGPALFGRTLTIMPAAGYALYARNSERSNAVFGLSLEQDAPNEGRFRLRGQLTPSYFARNYLADAVDGDASGTITNEERVYRRGEHQEGELSLDYRFRLAKSSKTRPFGAALQLGAGYYDRAYDAPFAGRDLHGPTAEAKLLLALSRRVSLDVSYDLAPLSATPANEVVLLDEAEFGQDFNGNGNSTDLNVRVVAPVDRSRTEHSLGGRAHIDLSKTAGFELSYEHRWRRFTSEEPLDASNNGRRDNRDQVGGEFAFRLAKGMKLRLGGRHSSQRTNQAGDPTAAGEINDYTKYEATLGLAYNF